MTETTGVEATVMLEHSEAVARFQFFAEVSQTMDLPLCEGALFDITLDPFDTSSPADLT